MILKSAECLGRAVGAGVLLGMLAWGAASHAEEWYELNEKALANIDFEGSILPANPANLLAEFPDARRERQRVDDEIGLACYEVGKLKNADAARFYFCDDRLYQLEIVYDLARVKKLGGMQAIVQQLVDAWGPADHIGESRWTWQRLTYNRRADLYSWPQRAQLTFTDMAWMPIVARRVKRADEREHLDLGL